MPQTQRLTRSSDFEAARRHGRAWSDSLLVLAVRPNGLDVTRVGYSVGGQVGNAVVRNTAKRRLREAVRLTSLQEGWDLILIARKGASTADYRTLSRSVSALVRRAEVLVAPPHNASAASKGNQ